jgi:hypothetical protein
MTGKEQSMMSSITSKDIMPFSDFSLRWRFTEESHRVLPKEDLSLIQPLTRTKAAEFNKHSLEYLGNASLLKSKFSEIESLKISDDHEAVGVWLLSKEIVPETRVAVSWDKTNCVITSWGIFCKYWDDFCYPSSDDVLVWSQQEDWFLYYCHHEIFEYGTRKL